jgi:sugar lactone lactonase YvrE|tara:strand:+ start:2098 stop:2982 length:885 start_codon:yes stop_codon:yes gene_type:complete
MKKINYFKPKVLIKSETALGEGPIWNYKTSELTFVDIISGKFFIWKKNILKSFHLPYKVSCLLPYKDKSTWIATSKNKILKISIINKKIKFKIIKIINEPKQNRFNDGKCDQLGRLWISSMDNQEKVPSGQLWFMKSATKLKVVDNNFIIGNGIDWSPDNKILYFVASDKRVIYSYSFDIKNGKLSNKKILIKVPKKRGYPDGICTDSEGFIWVAYWDGSCVIRHFANGKIDKVIKLPIKRPTSLTFGGKNLDLLFITSAQTFNKKNQKLEKYSGNIFVIKTNIQGNKINFYKN